MGTLKIYHNYITCIVLEVIVHQGVLVVSPQFEMQSFVPGQEPVYINNEAPSPCNFFQTRTLKSRLPRTYILQCQ